MTPNGSMCLRGVGDRRRRRRVDCGAAQTTDQHIQELIREAAAQRAGVDRADRGGPVAAGQPAGQGDRPTVQLTLDDAVKLALERNLDIAVQRLNPQTFDYSHGQRCRRSTSRR